MKINDKIEFSITQKYGAAIRCFDRELTDELDDYLTENFDVDVIFDFQDEFTILYISVFTSHEDVERKLHDFLIKSEQELQ